MWMMNSEESAISDLGLIELLSQNVSEGTKKNTNDLNQNCQYPAWDLNRVPLQQESRTVLLR
jgi:hypothetical protein